MLAQVAALAKSSKCKSIGIVLPEDGDKDAVQFVTQVSLVHSLEYLTHGVSSLCLAWARLLAGWENVCSLPVILSCTRLLLHSCPCGGARRDWSGYFF